MKRTSSSILLALTLLAAANHASAHDLGGRRGAVFTISNEASGNRVIAFARDRDGRITERGSYPTGGRGSSDSLSSQGALVLTGGARYLLAVDAGSNEVSSFAVEGAKLSFRSRVSSGGTRPVSVSERDGLVYVLNAGDDGNIAGFVLDHAGVLHPLPGSRRPLGTPRSGPAQIAISPDARTLVVSERTANELVTYALDRFGRAGEPEVFASEGETPFGFAITRRGDVVVSEAASQSVSSYELTRDGELEPVSAAVVGAQAAPCWVALSRDQRIAYIANAGSESISAYGVDRRGKLTLIDAVSGDTGEGSRPLDLALDRSGQTLYALDRGRAVVQALSVEDEGNLTPLASAGTLPPFASGVAAY